MTEVAKHASLTEALIAAQMDFGIVRKDAMNPHFKAKYADLATVIDAVLPSLNANGIALTQPVERDETGMVLRTRLIHTSGQELVSEVPLPHATQWQQWGSALTYARRYTLMALLGVAPEDDDGNEAAGASPSAKGKNVTPQKPAQPLEAPRYVKLVDAWGAEYLKLPGEVDEWIRDAIEGATLEELQALMEKNPDRIDIRMAVQCKVEEQDTGLAGVTLSVPPRGKALKERCEQIAGIFRGEQTIKGLNRQEARVRAEMAAMPDRAKAKLAEIFHECREALSKLKPDDTGAGAGPGGIERDTESFDDDVAHLEPEQWRKEEGRVEDPRQPELLEGESG